jgi:hypothetical protein
VVAAEAADQTRVLLHMGWQGLPCCTVRVHRYTGRTSCQLTCKGTVGGMDAHAGSQVWCVEVPRHTGALPHCCSLGVFVGCMQDCQSETREGLAGVLRPPWAAAGASLGQGGLEVLVLHVTAGWHHMVTPTAAVRLQRQVMPCSCRWTAAAAAGRLRTCARAAQ